MSPELQVACRAWLRTGCPVASSLQASRLDDVEKRWRRLVGPRSRERRCTFRCSKDCAYQAAAAFFRLTRSRRSQSAVVNRRPRIRYVIDLAPRSQRRSGGLSDVAQRRRTFRLRQVFGGRVRSAQQGV